MTLSRYITFTYFLMVIICMQYQIWKSLITKYEDLIFKGHIQIANKSITYNELESEETIYKIPTFN
jgi:hypothetical protein